MRALFASAALLLGFAAAAPAQAGGIALLETVGVHVGDRLSAEGGRGTWFDNGLGLELFLGKRHGRAEARFRFFWNASVDTLDNATTHSGALGVGGRIELLKDTAGRAGLYVAGDLGVSPVVQHNQAFFYVSLGPGVRVDLAGPLSFYAEPSFVVRVDDTVAVGPWVHLGIRAHFD